MIRIAPMLNVTETELAEGIDAMLAAVTDLSDS